MRRSPWRVERQIAGRLGRGDHIIRHGHRSASSCQRPLEGPPQVHFLAPDLSIDRVVADLSGDAAHLWIEETRGRARNHLGANADSLQ